MGSSKHYLEHCCIGHSRPPVVRGLGRLRLAAESSERLGVNHLMLDKQVAERFDKSPVFLQNRGGTVLGRLEDFADTAVDRLELGGGIASLAVAVALAGQRGALLQANRVATHAEFLDQSPRDFRRPPQVTAAADRNVIEQK